MIELEGFGLRPPEDLEGHRLMLWGILTDAVHCWQRITTCGFRMSANANGYITTSERLYREADFWIFGEYDNGPFFSFTQVCHCLGLDPDFIRRRLLEWRSQAASPASEGISTNVRDAG